MRTPGARRRSASRLGRAAAFLGLLAAGCVADRPLIADGGGSLETCAGPYADLLVEYTGGARDEGMPALGAPDSVVVPLTPPAGVTVGFVGLGGVRDEDGADLQIHGAFGDDGSVAVYVAASDGVTFHDVGLVDGETATVDVRAAGSVLAAVYVRLVGASGAPAIDAVQALHATCP